MSEILKNLEEIRHNFEMALADQRRSMSREYDNLNAETKHIRQVAKDEIEKLQQTNQRLVELVEDAIRFIEPAFRRTKTNWEMVEELRAEIKKVKGEQ